MAPSLRFLKSRVLPPSLALIASVSAATRQSVRRVDFNRDIRPILSDRCFKCHGFDAKARKAELRLDTWAGMTRLRKGRRPVVPGKPDASELIRRIEHDDPKVAMPQRGSQLTLNADERRLLRRWIAEGADFALHWGFVPPRPQTPPPVEHRAWPRNAVDRFVLAQLERHGLEPSGPASRATLIRRVSLDLTGLPPTPEEIDAFLADAAPGAYERVVDRLLASPRFGERMALVWLDAARYADTNGFHHDNTRTVWPYRDWVIRAFNENKPFDRFVVDQLAGDLLENATDQQKIATAFCRMHNINDEGGALDPEYRVEAVCDRIETIATTFMGLTFTCCRCHDHKYDPFTQDDYYSLYAYFNSVDERGVYPNNFEQARAYPARLAYKPPELVERIARVKTQLDLALADLAKAEPAIAAERITWEKAFRAEHAVVWARTKLVEASATSGSKLRVLPDGSALASGKPATDRHRLVLETEATGLRLLRFDALTDASLPEQSVGLAKNGNAVVTHIAAEAVSVRNPAEHTPIEFVWAWADHEQPNGDFDVHNVLRADKRGWALEGFARREPRTALLFAKQPFGFEGGTRVIVTVAYESRYPQHIAGRTRIALAAAKASALDAFPTVTSDWFEARFKGKSFDTLYAKAQGPETVERFDPEQRFGKTTWKHRPKIRDGRVLPLRGPLTAFYFARTLRTPIPRKLELGLGSDDAIRVFLNGKEVFANKALRGVAADQDKTAITLCAGENTLLVKVVNFGGPAGFYFKATAGDGMRAVLMPVAWIAPEDRSEALQQAFVAEWGAAHSPTFAKVDARVREKRKEIAKIESESVPVLIMKELAKPVPMHVLRRGRYDMADAKRPVHRRPPELLGVLEANAPNNRLGFARWLVRPDHPLTARVHVNRLWQMLFGRGLVATAENFGQQSDWPTHPALLDWLARRFVASGWDQKKLLRLLVTSATYRQSSVAAAAAKAHDPGNRLLAWFPRRRLAGELVRDQALFVAGLLSDRIGGPSVRPYQPAGLWREVSIGGSSNTQVFKRDKGEALYRRSLYTFWKRTSPNPQMTTFDAPTREFCVVRRNTTNTPLQVLVLWNDVQFLEAARVLAQRTLAEAATRDTRITRMFRRCTGRRPSAAERSILAGSLASFDERYTAAPREARQLIQSGDAPLPAHYTAAELAAWTMLATTLLSLDETIVRD